MLLKQDQEVNFFSRLNVLTWETASRHVTKLMDRLWEGKMKKYTEKVPHLFTENIRATNIL